MLDHMQAVHSRAGDGVEFFSARTTVTGEYRCAERGYGATLS